MKTKIIAIITIATFLVSSCQKETVSELGHKSNNVEIEIAKGKLIDFLNEKKIVKSDQISLKSTKNAKKSSPIVKKQNVLLNNNDFNYNNQFIKSIINPGNFVCGPTAINIYINNSVNTWSVDDFDIYFGFGDLATYEALLFDNTDGGDSYGINGENTQVLLKTMKDLKRFWNIPTEIQMADMHGTVYQNVPLVSLLIQILYTYDGVTPVTSEDADFLAGLLKIIFGQPQFKTYNHPLFTFNAFALNAIPELGVPKKIVMGDGILKAYSDLGFGDVAGQAILAHEYGHHIQIANNYFVGGPASQAAERTRRTELMADSYSAYFLTHSRGASMNKKRVVQFLSVFFLIGDCSFSSPGHHGTPNQRMKAANFGFSVAESAQKQGHILTSQEFNTLFESALPGLVTPDNI